MKTKQTKKTNQIQFSPQNHCQVSLNHPTERKKNEEDVKKKNKVKNENQPSRPRPPVRKEVLPIGPHRIAWRVRGLDRIPDDISNSRCPLLGDVRPSLEGPNRMRDAKLLPCQAINVSWFNCCRGIRPSRWLPRGSSTWGGAVLLAHCYGFWMEKKVVVFLGEVKRREEIERKEFLWLLGKGVGVIGREIRMLVRITRNGDFILFLNFFCMPFEGCIGHSWSFLLQGSF